jgi:hypothetical protein
MKKSKIIIGALFIGTLGLISASVAGYENESIHYVAKSGGGPTNNTNAPGEKTCSGTEGTNACHSGSIPDNTGPATTSITSSGGTWYVPGQTYTITCSITHATRTRFGFQCSPRRLSNNGPGGTITVTDVTNTWLHPTNFANCTSCQYICHKLAGTYFSNTTGSWTFAWTAPSSNIGNVRFYACFNAANNNNNETGDEIYYTTLTLTPSAVGINELEFLYEITISPNPSSGEVFVNTEITDIKEFSVFNVQGKLVEKFSSSAEINKIDLKSQPKGLYFIKISLGDKSTVKKVVIE